MASSNTTIWSWAGENRFRILFPFTLPWIPLFYFAEYLYGLAPEGSVLHNLFESLIVPGALVVSALFSIALYRLWPSFLRVKGKVPVWFAVKKIVINTLLVFIALTVLTVLISLLIDPPPWESDNPQYIPMVFFAVVFFPPLLTPIFALIAIWGSIVRNS